MLRAEQPDDYVIATGRSHSLAEFAAATFAAAGLDWRDHVAVDPALLRQAPAKRDDPAAVPRWTFPGLPRR